MTIAVAGKMRAATAGSDRKDLLRAVTNASKIATKPKKGSEGNATGSLATNTRQKARLGHEREKIR